MEICVLTPAPRGTGLALSQYQTEKSHVRSVCHGGDSMKRRGQEQDPDEKVIKRKRLGIQPPYKHDPSPDTEIDNVLKFIPRNELVKMRSLEEVKPYLPATVGGLTIKVYDGPEPDLVKERTNVVRFVSNTPAMGSIAKKYSPFAIARHALQRLSKHPNRDYDPELQKFDGYIDGQPSMDKQARGHTNPFHLFHQMIAMGPDGDMYKRGPAPMPWDVHSRAVRKITTALQSAGVHTLKPAHMVLCTEDSKGDGVPFAMLKDKAAAMPFILNSTRKPRKGNWLLEAVNLARKILVPAYRGLLFWPGVVYKRYDRPAPIEIYGETDKALETLILQAKDRAIIAQPFPSQLAEGVILRPVQKAIQSSKVPELDVRTPYHTSNVLEDVGNWVQQEGGSESRFTIGVDESGWDHHMTPQSWYAAFQIVRSCYPKTIKVGWIECDEFVVFDKISQRKLDEVAPGNTIQLEVRTRTTKSDGTVRESICVAKAGMTEIDTDTFLRRVLATTSGNDILLGDIVFSGYRHILETPDDGKVMLGYGMRSGNWGTFLMNSFANWYKAECYQIMATHPVARSQFNELYGYDLPSKLLVTKKLFRGDDAVLGIEVDSESAQRIRQGTLKPSVLLADLIAFTGGKANAKKQETSDTLGRFMVGFSQIFANEQYPRGVSSWTRVMERMMWREEDEATGIDPTTGEDLRYLIGDMGNWSRLSNLYGSFGKGLHPLRDLVIGLWQDLDIPELGHPGRLVPPRDAETRVKLNNLFLSRLIRRGQAPPGAEDMVNMWDTDLGPELEERYHKTQELRGSWNPISSSTPPEDARPFWRPRIQ